MPDEDMPKLLEIIHSVKTVMMESRKKAKVKKSRKAIERRLPSSRKDEVKQAAILKSCKRA